MSLFTSVSQIRALGPCISGYRFALDNLAGDDRVSAAAAREAGCSFEDMCWYLSSQAGSDPEIDRRLRMWRADVAARVLPVFEKEFPRETAPRFAIIVARGFASGAATQEQLDQAVARAKKAEDLAWLVGRVRAAQAAAAARVCGEVRAAWVVSRCATECLRENAVAELAWQYDRLIAWFTGDGPEPLALAWPADDECADATAAESTAPGAAA